MIEYPKISTVWKREKRGMALIIIATIIGMILVFCLTWVQMVSTYPD